MKEGGRKGGREEGRKNERRKDVTNEEKLLQAHYKHCVHSNTKINSSTISHQQDVDEHPIHRGTGRFRALRTELGVQPVDFPAVHDEIAGTADPGAGGVSGEDHHPGGLETGPRA